MHMTLNPAGLMWNGATASYATFHALYASLKYRR